MVVSEAKWVLMRPNEPTGYEWLRRKLRGMHGMSTTNAYSFNTKRTSAINQQPRMAQQ